ncbi:pyrroline-5-carboxylate reductase family protein [Sphingomicrobium marinum]|uniref:pyrroline-5-carboxylate reductase family protein n=1 Tax=Sphingomicrobium marinum TaxID=1227950 RepID=UPI00223F98A4|nr:pyrroline-5-carboxylate reductase dimerization domain-containing protein [Sphingomicrobium marinum]
MLPETSWFVGCGNMGGAMVEGWRKAGVDLSGMTAVSPSGRDIPGLRVVTSIPDGEPKWCFLGFKPQMIDAVVPDLEPHVGSDTVLLSILAGVELDSLRAKFPRTKAVVRLMPNLPVSEGEGVTALLSDDADAATRGAIQALHEKLGFAPWCKSDDELVLMSAIAGSGPAYVARFVDAFAVVGRELGLDKDVADKLALETVAGTGLMARKSGGGMRDLAKRVASPGGTTEAGLKVLDADDGIVAMVREVVAAARRRSDEMAAAARD